MNHNNELITVEVAYATPEKQKIITLHVPINTAILDAINQSKICEEFAELKMLHFDHITPIGIFGKKIDPQTYQLQDKDRIEIYRPLAKTPNQRRLERAKNARCTTPRIIGHVE